MEAGMKGLPEKGFFKRMRIYFREMYPPGIRFISAAIIYISFTLFMGRIHNIRASLLSPYTLLGIWNIFIILLILRLMDELKDKEIDLKLFKERPLPSGRVLESDISFSLVAMVFLYLSTNIWAGKAFWIAVAVIVYSLLMFKHFFIPHILRKYLLLTLATHSPIIAFILFIIVVLFSIQHGKRKMSMSPILKYSGVSAQFS
jgi:4-hydroxybenzoate polyprenyltransferase